MKTKIRYILFLSVALGFSAAVDAQSTEQHMNVNAGGQVESSALDKVDKITFSDNGFTVVKTDKTEQTFDYDAVITFTDETTGINSAQLSKSGIKVYSPKGSHLIYIEGIEKGRVEIFSVNGASVLRNSSWRGEPVDVGSLPKGVYILRVGKQSFKFNK